MGLKKITVISLADSLSGMEVGETCLIPETYTLNHVRVICSNLKHLGFIFLTSTKTGAVTVTRLK